MQKEIRIAFFIERLGDRIGIKYITEYYKEMFPKFEFWAYQRHDYESVRGFDITEWAPGLYTKTFYRGDKINGEVVDDISVCRLVGAERLWFSPGNIWNFCPKAIMETGKRPTLTLPERYRVKLDEEGWSKKDKPIICFHPLLDAPYQRSRNHYWPEWKRAIELLSKEDVIIYRVGTRSAMGDVVENDRNVFDFAARGADPCLSMALVSACDIYVGGDTGMTHAAAAFNKNIVGIWGDCTHMLKDHSKPNNIQPGDWDTGPYVPPEQLYMMRRDRGADMVRPIFTAEQILEGVYHFLRR